MTRGTRSGSRYRRREAKHTHSPFLFAAPSARSITDGNCELVGVQVLLELLQVGSVVQFNEERLLTLAEKAKL